MRRLSLPVALVVALSACGGSPTTPTPPVLPRASIVTAGDMKAPATCPNDLCDYQGTARNDGPGCAAAIGGITTLRNETGASLASVQWSIAPTAKIAVGQTFTYTLSVNYAMALATKQYNTQFSWTDVACN